MVRSTTSKPVSIKNTSDKVWRINPTISTAVDSCKDFFKGNHMLDIPAGGTADYEIIYAPLTMTKEKTSGEGAEEQTIILYHEASLFFPLPDGSAQLYKLFGTSTSPSVSEDIEKTIKAKKQQYISIPVENWLKIPQRFAVSWEIESGNDQTVFIRGAGTFDVASASKKEYKLNFLAYKAGTTKFVITFKNQGTGEYLFYNITVNATEPDIVATLDLAAPVRESVSKIITIENPTSSEVQVNRSQFVISNEYVDIVPESLAIPPQSERGFEINYRPLIVSEEESELVLKSPELGEYKYKLLLKGLVSTTQRSLHFKTALGSELVQAFRFNHYLKKATNYTVKCERLDGNAALQCDFKAEQATVAATDAKDYHGVELTVNIKYEPTNIGESRGILKLNSPENIEYTCILYGHSTAPQPQVSSILLKTLGTHQDSTRWKANSS
jgi:hydrocephalus-inducing protein